MFHDNVSTFNKFVVSLILWHIGLMPIEQWFCQEVQSKSVQYGIAKKTDYKSSKSFQKEQHQKSLASMEVTRLNPIICV